MDDDGSKQLNKEEFMHGIRETGLELSQHVYELFFSILNVNLFVILIAPRDIMTCIPECMQSMTCIPECMQSMN